MTPAAARSRGRTHARRNAPPRRISGPVPAPAGAPLPRNTSVFGRIRALPEHRIVDRLLRSRLWIWALGLGLGGIVTMQVSLLKLNSGITRAVETTATLERQNADLEASIARLSSPDRIESGATTLGMLMPPAGDVGYLSAGPRDATKAVRRMQPPSDAATALMANHGIVPGSLAPAPVVAAAPLEPTVPAAPAESTAPAGSVAPAAPAVNTAPAPTTALAAPAATTAPVAPAATTAPAAPAAATSPTTTSQAPAAGGAVAGQG
jgi:cell division protein FtsL